MGEEGGGRVRVKRDIMQGQTGDKMRDMTADSARHIETGERQGETHQKNRACDYSGGTSFQRDAHS